MTDITIIATDSSELRSMRASLMKRHGISLKTLREISLPDDFSVLMASASLHASVGASDTPIWVIELELHTPPFGNFWKYWTVDKEPTDPEAIQIMTAEEIEDMSRAA